MTFKTFVTKAIRVVEKPQTVNRSSLRIRRKIFSFMVDSMGKKRDQNECRQRENESGKPHGKKAQAGHDTQEQQGKNRDDRAAFAGHEKLGGNQGEHQDGYRAGKPRRCLPHDNYGGFEGHKTGLSDSFFIGISPRFSALGFCHLKGKGHC